MAFVIGLSATAQHVRPVGIFSFEGGGKNGILGFVLEPKWHLIVRQGNAIDWTPALYLRAKNFLKIFFRGR